MLLHNSELEKYASINAFGGICSFLNRSPLLRLVHKTSILSGCKECQQSLIFIVMCKYFDWKACHYSIIAFLWSSHLLDMVSDDGAMFLCRNYLSFDSFSQETDNDFIFSVFRGRGVYRIALDHGYETRPKLIELWQSDVV